MQLLVQLTDALRQLGQLLGDDSAVNGLRCVRLHVKLLRHEVGVALCSQREGDTQTRDVRLPVLWHKNKPPLDERLLDLSLVTISSIVYAKQ